MAKITVIHIIVTAILFLAISNSISIGAPVVSEGNKISIRDRTGELWDITEAVDRGFKPRKFQYGLGKSAITPLGDGDLATNQNAPGKNTKILGITSGNESDAHVISKMSYHEIANTTINGTEIVAAY